MSNLPFIVALVCAVILLFLSSRRGAKVVKEPLVFWAAAGASLLLGWVALGLEPLGIWRFAAAGALFGFGVTALTMSFPENESVASLAAGLLFGCGFVQVFAPPDVWDATSVLAWLSGGAAAAGLLALRQRSSAAAQATVLGMLGWGAAVLGKDLAAGEARQSTLNIFAVALLALLIGEGLSALTKSSKFPWPRWATAALFGAMAFFVVVRTVTFPDLPVAVGGSALVAVAMYAVHRGLPDSTATALIGGLVWLGVATASFSFARGYGLALAGVVGAVTSWICGERRLLAWMSPLFALAVYRVVRFLYPDASRAFDIGQHYALVGLLIGIVLPILLTEWGRGLANRKAWQGSISVFLGGLATLAGTSAAVAFLGAKGSSGMVIGFLASPLVSAIKGEPPKTALTTSMGLAAWAAVSIGVFASEEDLARPDKVKLLATVGLVVAVLAVAASLVGRPKREALVS